MSGRDDYYSRDSVKIPYDIFMMLCHHHLLGDGKPSELMEIKLYLKDKMHRLHNHYAYIPRAQRQPSGQKQGQEPEKDPKE